jgi:iron(III) transport system permease protein
MEVLLGIVLFAILIAPLLALMATSLVPTLGVPLNGDTLTFAAWRGIVDAQSATWRALTNSMLLSGVRRAGVDAVKPAAGMAAGAPSYPVAALVPWRH